MSEDLLLWLVVAGFTLAVWLLERVKAARARQRRPVAATVPAVPIPLPVTTSVPAQETPLPVPPPLPRPVTRPRTPPPRLVVRPAARVRLRLTPRTARQGIVLAAVLGPCKGLE